MYDNCHSTCIIFTVYINNLISTESPRHNFNNNSNLSSFGYWTFNEKLVYISIPIMSCVIEQIKWLCTVISNQRCQKTFFVQIMIKIINLLMTQFDIWKTSYGSTVDQAQRPYTNLQLQRRATKAKHAKLTTNSQTVEEKKIEKEEAAEKERRKKSTTRNSKLSLLFISCICCHEKNGTPIVSFLIHFVQILTGGL